LKLIPAKLILQNGRIFEGHSFGKLGTSIGEVCFNTGMTGYQEIITDPSYCGQLVTLTYPHIGNYGVNTEDVESNKVQASGLIIKEGSPIVSNFRANESLNHYLIKNNVVAIQGIDTRSLTRILRNEGSMNGIISSEKISISKLREKLSNHPSMDGMDLVKKITCKNTYNWNENNKKYKVAAIDFGIKHNILKLLDNEDCYIKVFPGDTNANTIKTFNPDGIFLSNGPGDPAAVTYAIENVKKLLRLKIPIFGICLGHQILSLALGAKTYKLKFGHRGCNHPVKNLKQGNIEITSQNHGFAVANDKTSKDFTVTHISLNDKTIEGIECMNYPAFSIQYHPESSPGPHDSRYLFKQFINMMKKYKNAKKK
tara:strand:+ start:1908 stop:3014 length:1107 start_codon:yes stop_codon:yes gene_type:complete